VFEFRHCADEGCRDAAWGGSSFCRNHHPDPVGYEDERRRALLSGDEVLDSGDWSGLDFGGMDLRGRDFRYCRFTGTSWHEADLSGCRFRLCLMDRLDARSAVLHDTRMMSIVAAGSRFDRADFTGSDLINVNFNGIRAPEARFTGSNLYYSRFIGAVLDGASFRDCNLKRVDFTNAGVDKVDFRESNPEDAYFLEMGQR